MPRLACCAVVLLSLVAAGGADRRQEAIIGTVARLAQGELNVNQATTQLAAAGDDAMACQAVLNMLRQPLDPKSVKLLLQALAAVAVPNHDVESRLRRALNDEDILVRMAAARGLGRAKAVGAVAELEALVTDKLVGVRREAARALGALGQPRSASVLVAQAKVEEDPEARVAQLTALARTGDRQVSARVEPFLESGSESTRLAAAQTLCVLGAPRGLVFAKHLLGSKDRFERAQGVRLFEGVPLKVSSPVLKRLLDDPEPVVRATTARVLAQAGDLDKINWLVLEASKAPGDDRPAYERELELLHLSDDARAAIRRKAGLQ